MTSPLLAELSRPRPERPRLSVITPVFNEADAIALFLGSMFPILNQTGCDWDIHFVNDGSTDETLKVLLEGVKRSHRIKLINLARNFGKEAAMTAGLDLVDADIVVIIDVDLQDPPELILDFVAKWREGYDVVYGVRESRRDDTKLKRSTAQLFYRLFNRISRTKIPSNVGDFRLMDRRVVEAVRQLPERNRFMKGLLAWVGFSSAAVPFHRSARAAGQTKFRLHSLWNFALDGLFSFSTLPLKVWTYIGGLLAMSAVGYAVFIIGQTLLFGTDVPGYASLMVVLLTASAAQLLSLGIIGEYIARLTIETKQRPIYLIEGEYDRGRLLGNADGGAQQTSENRPEGRLNRVNN